MFANTTGGGKTQQQQPLQSQTNVSVRHNNPYQHSHTPQQPHYEHHQGPVTFVTYPFCNVGPATHGNTGANNHAVSGGQASHLLYPVPHQPPSQPHPTQQQVGLHNPNEQPLHYYTKSAPMPSHHLHHAPQQHSQIRNMIAAVSQRQPYMVSPNYFALLSQQPRASILTNAASQHAVATAGGGSIATQLQNTAHRNIGPSGPTSYVAPPYCTPPLMLGAAPTAVTPQTTPILTAATGMGQPPNLQAYTHISSGLSAAPQASTPINMQTLGNLGIGTSSNIQHKSKPRIHAIPIVHPLTKEELKLENLLDVQPKPQSQLQPQVQMQPQLQPQSQLKPQPESQSQPQSQMKSKISVESVSIQTDNNDRSLTASIASDPSEVVPQTCSQSLSASDTEKVEYEIQYEQDEYEVDKPIGGLDVATTTYISAAAPEVNNTVTQSQSLHSDSESLNLCAYEDPNDTDADTNEHELDNEDDVPDIADGNVPEAYIHQQPSVDIEETAIIEPEDHAEEILNTDFVTLQSGESDTDHSTETEVKSRDEPFPISVQTSFDRNDEEKSEEIHQDFQPSVPSLAITESKKHGKNRKANKNKRKEKKNQKNLKQQQQQSNNKNINVKNNTDQCKKEEPPQQQKPKFIRYSLDELKVFANLPESRKTPIVPCQKGDCIAQLFVARQQHNHHHSSHQVSQNLTTINLQQQSYHQMNFNESIEFVSGKRRAGGAGAIPRKHQEHHINSTSAGITNSIAGLPGTSGITNVGGGALQIQKKMQVIRINLSLNEEIKLSESKNAWQPKFLASNSTGESRKNGNEDIEDVLKKVRGILNKLTAENFDVLVKEMTKISINTQEKMQKVMLLIFEKTVNEPNFAPTYAKFSKVLFEELKADNKGVFNMLLIKRLEKEFEINVNNPDAKERKLQKIISTLNETKDEQDKIQLQAELEYQEYQFRRRAWGTVRFIGEMYKLHSLSSSRVLAYVESLLEHGNEEKLEYMCKLLTTVGNLLENGDSEPSNASNNTRMNKIFAKIQSIVKDARDPSHKKIKICSRVRFMMQDLIDLRSRNWGQSSFPHSSHIASIRRRIPEDKNSNLASGSLSNYDRGSSQRMSFGNNNRNSQTRTKESGLSGNSGSYFMHKSSKSQYLAQREREREQHSIDVKKLNFSRGDDTTQANTKLGNSSIYMWRIVTGRQSNQSNDLHLSDRNSPSSSQQQYSQKHQNQQQHMQAWNIKGQNSDADIKSILESFTNKDNQKLINCIMEEYLDCLSSRSNRWREEVLNIWEKTNNKQQICLVYYILMKYLHLPAVKRFERNACANIFIYLMTCNAFSKKIFTQAYEPFAEEFPDLLMDVPNGWMYVFQFLGPLLHERLLTFNDIWRSSWRSEKSFTERFVIALVNYFTKEFGANYMRNLWHKDFKLEREQLFKTDQQQWRQFVAANKLQFLYDCKAKPEITSINANNNSPTVMDEHLQRVEVILSSLNDSNLALDYINTNVNINSYFLKNLTRFLCCDFATTTKTTELTGSSRASSVTTSKNSSTCSNTSSSSSSNKSRDFSNNVNNEKFAQLNVDAFRKNCLPLLQLCLDAHEDNELNCLDSVVDAMEQQYDANTASQLICGIFDIFYDCEVIAKESFEKWYKQRQKQEQKKRPLSSHLETYMQKLL